MLVRAVISYRPASEKLTLYLLERKKQRETAQFSCHVIGLLELRPSPWIERTDIQGEAVDTGQFGSLNVMTPMLGCLSACEAHLCTITTWSQRPSREAFGLELRTM